MTISGGVSAAVVVVHLCYLLTGGWQLVWVLSQHSEVINNGLQMCYLSQHGNLYILEGETGWIGLNSYHINSKSKQSKPSFYISAIQSNFLQPLMPLTTTGCSRLMNVQ